MTVFQSISGRLPEREKEKRKDRREKKSKQPQPAPPASAVGVCPTVIQINRTSGTESLPSTYTPPDHPIFIDQILFTVVSMRPWFRTAEPLGGRRYENGITHRFRPVVSKYIKTIWVSGTNPAFCFHSSVLFIYLLSIFYYTFAYPCYTMTLCWTP